jgi:hypothetical protein
MENQKTFRRIVGFLAARLRQLSLGDVDDPRSSQGKRWKLEQVLAACLLGMMAGCKNLREVERLTSKLSRPIRRALGIPRRLPDTTARDLLCALSPQTLIPILHRLMSVASDGKQLEKTELPFHMVAMDGKVTWLPSWDGPYAQRQNPQEGLPYGLMRTVTSVLASTSSRPCIDVSPIPASTNEMGHFQAAFGAMCDRYSRLFKLVSYDQGANGEENALYVLERDKHYLFRLNDERRHMQQLAMELLADQDVVAETHDVVSNRDEVFRRLRIFQINQGVLPFAGRSELWPHSKTLVSVESETIRDGKSVNLERRYYASSLEAAEQTAEQWLACVRFHWRVELSHQTLDDAFSEDERPWIANDPNGMLVVLILRRIAFTLLTLYRSVTQRSEEKRQMPWAELFEWVRDTLVASTEATVASLRKRKPMKTLRCFAAA